MLEEIKSKGDLIAAQRPTADSAYIEGTVQKVHEEDGEYYYEIAWEDGKHFGEAFYEGELDEIDLVESEATVRVVLSEFFTAEAVDEWLDLPNDRLRGLAPLDALETLGLKQTLTAASDDYADALREAESFEKDQANADSVQIQEHLPE